MHFATAPCKISGSLPEIFLIEREGRALPPITVPLLLSFCSLSFCFGVSLSILQHALFMPDAVISAGDRRRSDLPNFQIGGFVLR